MLKPTFWTVKNMEITEDLSFFQRKAQALKVIDQYIDIQQLQKEFGASTSENAVTLDSAVSISEIYFQDYVNLYSQLTGISTEESFKNVFMSELQNLSLESEKNPRMKFIFLLLEQATQHQEIILKGINETLTSLKHCLPMRILYELKRYKLLELEEFLRKNINNNQVLKEFVYGLQAYVVSQSEEANKEAADLLSSLITSGYDFVSNKDRAMIKVCQYILQFVFRYLLIKMSDVTNKSHRAAHDSSIFDFIRIGEACNKEALRSCYVHQLVSYITHDPVLKVSEAVIQQNRWTSCNMPTPLAKTYDQIFMICDLDDAISIVKKAFLKGQVNWKSLLNFISALLSTFKDAALLLEGFIAEEIKKGLETNSTDNLVTGLIIARQCSYERGHLFMSYSEWFQKYFGRGTNCLVTSSRSFRFFIKFLTSLVPFEPLHHIRVHVAKPPHAPNNNLRELLQEYVSLAKTRIDDLKPSRDDDAERSIIAQEVKDAAAVFGKCGRIPSTVMEMSLFRKSHFKDKFLPVLLQARLLPDVADDKMNLISALCKIGRIPKQAYDDYKRKCDEESLKLYEGVVELENDFDDTDTLIDHFKAEIKEYVSVSNDSMSNELGLCKIGQPLNRSLHQLLPNSINIEDSESIAEVVDLTIGKDFDPSVKSVVDALSDAMSSLEGKAVDCHRLVYLLKIIESFPILKEAICYQIWKDNVYDIQTKSYQQKSGLVFLMLGCFCNHSWSVFYQAPGSLQCNESDKTISEKEISSLEDAVLRSLSFINGPTSFFNSTKFHLTFVEHLGTLRNISLTTRMTSTLYNVIHFLIFAKLKMECYLQTKSYTGSESRKRSKLNDRDDLANIDDLLHDVNKACEHLCNFLPGESGKELELATFMRLEVETNPNGNFLPERHKRRLYKNVLFRSTLPLASLESAVQFLLDKCTNTESSRFGYRQIISTFCNNLGLLLQANGCSSSAEWLLSIFENRVANITTNTSAQLKKEALMKLELSSFTNFLLLLPPTMLLHQTTASDANSSWSQAPNEMEEICLSLKVFLNDYVKDYFNNEFFFSYLVPHLIIGLIETAPEDHPLMTTYLASHLPLLVVSCLIQWDDMPDVKCASKIRQPHFHDVMSNVHSSVQLLSTSTSSTCNQNLSIRNDQVPSHLWCLAFICCHSNTDVAVASRRLQQLSSSMPEVLDPFITCLVAHTGKSFETSADPDLEWPSKLFECLLTNADPSILHPCTTENNSSVNALFPTCVCEVYFYVALLRLLSLVDLPNNFLSNPDFLPMLLAVHQRAQHQVECLDMKVHLLLIKSARSSALSVLKNESQNSSRNESVKTILKTELFKRYR